MMTTTTINESNENNSLDIRGPIAPAGVDSHNASRLHIRGCHGELAPDSNRIHPASRGVAAHTAGLFRSVRGAKFPPRDPSNGCFFHFSPVEASQAREFSLFPPVGASQAREFSLFPPVGASQAMEFSLFPPFVGPAQAGQVVPV